mmetsp:Transcript_28092/g.68269  ORF Transcript_28092/g.68269 Transcript_28092/m.68269 type:complete len:252 (+) Transcript_28092:530-1285(+)
MLSFDRPLMLRPTLSPGCASGTDLWCISTENTLPWHGADAECVGRNVTSVPGFTVPCSTRPVSTSPAPLILYTPEMGTRSGLSLGRSGTTTIFSSASRSVSMCTFSFFRFSTSTPLHHAILSDFLIRLSPTQPLIGITGTDLATKSFFQPTLVSMPTISSLISVYRSLPYLAMSQSILLMPTTSCFTPSRLMSSACCRVWPCTSPALWLPLAMAAVKLPSAGTMSSATSACDAPVIMFLMKSRCPGASITV